MCCLNFISFLWFYLFIYLFTFFFFEEGKVYRTGRHIRPCSHLSQNEDPFRFPIYYDKTKKIFIQNLVPQTRYKELGKRQVLGLDLAQFDCVIFTESSVCPKGSDLSVCTRCKYSQQRYYFNPLTFPDQGHKTKVKLNILHVILHLSGERFFLIF